jgi:DNA-binding protein HU-beta
MAPLSLLHKFFNHTKNNVMNKGELIDKIAKDTKLTKGQAGDALDAVLGAVTGTLAKGGKVTLVGFGTFSVSSRAKRKGRNPRTGKEINIKAKKVAKFKAGAELAKKVNK